MSTPLIRSTMAAVAVIALAAGCSGSDDSAEKDPAPTPSESGTPTVLIGPGSSIKNNLDARGDVEVTSCTQVKGKTWRVRAEATNSTKADVRYQLALRYARADDGSVIGRVAVKSDVVAPGESTTLSVTRTLEERAKQVNCIFVAIDRVEV